MTKLFRVYCLATMAVVGVLHAAQQSLPPLMRTITVTPEKARTLICPRSYKFSTIHMPNRHPMQVVVAEPTENVKMLPRREIEKHHYSDHLFFSVDTENATSFPPDTVYTCKKEENEAGILVSGKRG